MNITGPTLTSASSDIQQIDYTSSSGLVVGYTITGSGLPATCSPAYGELCPLDGATAMATLGFTEVYTGYDLDIENVVVAANDAVGTALVISEPATAISVTACTDTDTDTVCDAVDVCSGFDDLSDNDADGTPDGCDDCDNDPNKVVEGVCGCDVADTDCSFVSLGNVVELPASCEWVCYSTADYPCHPTLDTVDWVEECGSPGYGLEVNYYAGQDVTGFQFNVSNLNITGATGGATDGMEIFFSDNGNVAGIIDPGTGAGTAAAGNGLLTYITFDNATDASSALTMDSSDAMAGPGLVPFVFSSPTNQAQASGSVSHCGENGISNSSAYWTDATCSADCGGSYYANNLVVYIV